LSVFLGFLALISANFLAMPAVDALKISLEDTALSSLCCSLRGRRTSFLEGLGFEELMLFHLPFALIVLMVAAVLGAFAV